MGRTRCSWCGRDMGERPGMPDAAVTHGMCPACAAHGARLNGEAEPLADALIRLHHERDAYREALVLIEAPPPGQTREDLRRIAREALDWHVSGERQAK